MEGNKKRKCNCWLEIDSCYCEEDKDNKNLCGKCQGNKDCHCK